MADPARPKRSRTSKVDCTRRNNGTEARRELVDKVVPDTQPAPASYSSMRGDVGAVLERWLVPPYRAGDRSGEARPLPTGGLDVGFDRTRMDAGTEI